jgi:hypothetical protein
VNNLIVLNIHHPLQQQKPHPERNHQSSVPSDNIIRPTSTPSKTTTIKETSPIPTTVIKPEETSKSVETIPKFYFPNGQLTPTSSVDTLLNKQLRQVKKELFLPKHDKLHLEDFGRLAQVFIHQTSSESNKKFSSFS